MSHMLNQAIATAVLSFTLLHHTSLASPLLEGKPDKADATAPAAPTSGVDALARLGSSVRSALAITPEETRARQMLVYAKELHQRAREVEQRAIAKINTLARLNDALESQNAGLHQERVRMTLDHAREMEEAQTVHEHALLKLHARLAELQARACVDAQARRNEGDACSGSLALPLDPAARQGGEVTVEGDGQKRDTGSGAYFDTFRRGQGVMQARSGMWYKIHSRGETELRDDALVSVRIKETLTDGTTVLAKGQPEAALTQPLACFTPLFKEAITLLNGQGAMTLVVPSGPSGTLQIYHLTVSDSPPYAAKMGGEISSSGITPNINVTG